MKLNNTARDYEPLVSGRKDQRTPASNMGSLLVGSLYPYALLHQINIPFRKNRFVVQLSVLVSARASMRTVDHVCAFTSEAKEVNVIVGAASSAILPLALNLITPTPPSGLTACGQEWVVRVYVCVEVPYEIPHQPLPDFEISVNDFDAQLGTCLTNSVCPYRERVVLWMNPSLLLLRRQRRWCGNPWST